MSSYSIIEEVRGQGGYYHLGRNILGCNPFALAEYQRSLSR